MPTLWHLALEPFEQRYTADWYRWFQQEYKKDKINYWYIDGQSLTDKIETGRFLDTYNTIHWKSTQMAEVAKLFREGRVQGGDVFFTTDLWHPGIEAVLYMAQLSEIDVKLYGILHAGTYDPHDFTAQLGLGYWAGWHEVGWIRACEKVFVGSQFHKEMILWNRGGMLTQIDEDRIVVTGLPFYPAELLSQHPEVGKENLVVFPHRLDPEKNPTMFSVLKKALARDGVECVRSYDVCKTKAEYYQLLARARVAVSFSDQETFGYAMLEASALGCHPVVPDKLSYVEMYPDLYRYPQHDIGAAIDAVRAALYMPIPVPLDTVTKYEGSIHKMLSEMYLTEDEYEG